MSTKTICALKANNNDISSVQFVQTYRGILRSALLASKTTSQECKDTFSQLQRVNLQKQSGSVYQEQSRLFSQVFRLHKSLIARLHRMHYRCCNTLAFKIVFPFKHYQLLHLASLPPDIILNCVILWNMYLSKMIKGIESAGEGKKGGEGVLKPPPHS